jgi:hypothetical protein
MRKTSILAFAVVVALSARTILSSSGVDIPAATQDTKKAASVKKATANDAVKKAASSTKNGTNVVTLLANAQTTAVGQPMTIGNQTCGPQGGPKSGSINGLSVKEKDLNRNKNRTDNATHPVAVQWQQLANLPANKVGQIQGAPVVVVGYLSHAIKVEGVPDNTTGESTNCYWTTDNAVDWHIYLTSSPNQGLQMRSSSRLLLESGPIIVGTKLNSIRL